MSPPDSSDPPSTISQHQIAEKLGLSQATVSMGLAGNPKVSLRTRQAILQAAEELGYRPDPSLRALARYRRSVRPAYFHASIAWVHNASSATWWRHSAVFQIMFDSARERAEKLGYTLENFWIPQGRMSGSRATEILISRGVQALLLLPYFDQIPEIDLDWSKFTTVALVDQIHSSGAHHLVGSDHYIAARRVLAEVAARGYRRPGLISSHQIENASIEQYSSAYLERQQASGVMNPPPILYSEKTGPKEILRWVKKHRVDVVLLAYVCQTLEETIQALASLPDGIPGGIGVAMLCLPDRTAHKSKLPAFSGIDEGFALIGRRGIELAISLCESFEKGVPVAPIRHLVAGKWQEGETLRPMKESKI